MLVKEPPSSEDEPRILELLAQLEHASPPHFNDASSDFLAFRRALALRQMGKLGLALIEMKDARRARADDPMFTFVYLDLLRLEDLPSAVSEAQSIAGIGADVPALVLSACINTLTAWAEQAVRRRIRLDRRASPRLVSSDLIRHPISIKPGRRFVALSYFNRGLIHLRAGRISLARQAFQNAQQHYPVGPILDEVTGLQTYDRHAREVAERVRTIIAEQFSMRPVAA